jgi:hypothetical protein
MGDEDEELTPAPGAEGVVAFSGAAGDVESFIRLYFADPAAFVFRVEGFELLQRAVAASYRTSEAFRAAREALGAEVADAALGRFLSMSVNDLRTEERTN